MIQEEKDLLLKDLCGRLPYYTELYTNFSDNNWAILTPVIISNLISAANDMVLKPYLRPMSDMTIKETREFLSIANDASNGNLLSFATQDWLNAHHFDYRRLIEKGLALEAPENMYLIV